MFSSLFCTLLIQLGCKLDCQSAVRLIERQKDYLNSCKETFREDYSEEIAKNGNFFKATWISGIIVNDERIEGLNKQAEIEGKVILTFDEFLERQNAEANKVVEVNDKEIDDKERQMPQGGAEDGESTKEIGVKVAWSEKLIIRLGV